MARLTRMATACPGDLAGLRDRALLLLASAGLHWSALTFEQIHFIEAGVDPRECWPDNCVKLLVVATDVPSHV